jgi:chemotaxis protein histidine kinase CheA
MNGTTNDQPEKLFGLVAFQAAGNRDSANAGRPVVVVDQVIDIREVVVQTFTDPLVARPGVAGATELGDGGLAIILDFPALLRLTRQPSILS